jgi:glycerol-3-phosphate acyltransferase PlsY
MKPLLSILLWSVASYGLGCVSAAYYAIRMRTGQDIRGMGSGNAGARNAGRALGRGGFVLVFVADAAKGCFALWGAQQLGLGAAGATAAMLAVVAGHIWPVQLGFRGGKGISTSFGALLLLDWRVALMGMALCLVLFALSRHFTVAGLLAVAAVPGLAAARGHPLVTLAGVTLLAAVVLGTHRENVRRIPGELAGARLARRARATAAGGPGRTA